LSQPYSDSYQIYAIGCTSILMCISNASCVHHRDIMPTELTADEGPSFITSGQGDIVRVRTPYHAPQISEAESKVWTIKNNTNLNSIFCLIKSSKIDFIFLPALYLIMWLMKSHKNFEKIRAVFLLRFQNSLWWGKILICY
jgi:hypothetical protein